MSYVANSPPGTDGPVQKLESFILFGQEVDVIGLTVWDLTCTAVRRQRDPDVRQSGNRSHIHTVCVECVCCEMERPRRAARLRRWMRLRMLRD